MVKRKLIQVRDKILGVNAILEAIAELNASLSAVRNLQASQTDARAPAPVAQESPSANAEEWSVSQAYELDFWKNHWEHRNLSVPELQEHRLAVARWLLTNLDFEQTGPRSFAGFAGTVLEVGCGPMGFFELVEGVQVTANDSLMTAYAREIPFATLGRRGNALYVDTDLASIADQFRFVVCSNVLDHTADWLEFLELLSARVEPGGELLLVTDARGRPVLGHTQIFSPSQVERACRWLGLTSVKYSRVDKSTDDHSDYRLFLRAGR